MYVRRYVIYFAMSVIFLVLLITSVITLIADEAKSVKGY
jgi:hypothetical protein